MGEELPVELRLKVRQAVLEDLAAIDTLYDGVIDLFQAQTGEQAWRKGVYPTEEDFRSAIQAGTMYVGELEGQLAAGMIVTQGTDKSYGDAPWQVDALDSETAVIHTLGVSPGAGKQGVGRQMLEGAAALAREKGWMALRLDVLESNTAAQRLYERAGFAYIATKKIWYESTGLASFLLYEYRV